MTIITTPQRTCFVICAHGRGVAIIHDGTWVGPGGAAHNTSRTSRSESIEIGTFPVGPLYYCHPFIIAIWTFFVYFRAPNLFQSKFVCPGFSRAGNKTLLSPLLLMLSKHECLDRPPCLSTREINARCLGPLES